MTEKIEASFIPSQLKARATASLQNTVDAELQREDPENIEEILASGEIQNTEADSR